MSSRLEARISGVGKLLARLGEVQNVIFSAVATEVAAGAMAIHADAVKSIQAKASSGGTVKRYSPKRVQVVSAQGNPPNTDLGTLVHSIHFEIDKANFTAVVGTNLLYGKFLETGTGKMKARPWLLPAFQRHSDEIRRNVSEAIRNAIRGSR